MLYGLTIEKLHTMKMQWDGRWLSGFHWKPPSRTNSVFLVIPLPCWSINNGCGKRKIGRWGCLSGAVPS